MAITHVQEVLLSNQGNGTLTSFTVTLSGVTAGNSLVLTVVSGSTANTSGSGSFAVSDNVGGTWSSLAPADTGHFYTKGVFACFNAKGGNTTVTITTQTNLGVTGWPPDGGGGGLGAWLAEFTTFGSVDQKSINTGTSTTPTEGTLATLQQTGELVVVMTSLNVAATVSPSSPWTAVTGPGIFGANLAPLAWQVAASTTPANASWTTGSSAAWTAIAVTFQQPGTTTPITHVQETVTNNQGNASATSFQITLNGVTAGDTLFLAIESGSVLNTAGSGTFTVSDNVSGSWAKATNTNTGTYYSTALYWCQNAPGGNTTVTVVCQYAPDSQGHGMWLAEFTTCAALDQAPANKSANSTAPSQTAYANPLAAQGELCIVITSLNTPAATSPGSPWTDVTGAQVFGAALAPIAWDVNTGTTTPPTAAAWTTATAHAWTVLAASFTPGVGTGGGGGGGGSGGGTGVLPTPTAVGQAWLIQFQDNFTAATSGNATSFLDTSKWSLGDYGQGGSGAGGTGSLNFVKMQAPGPTLEYTGPNAVLFDGNGHVLLRRMNSTGNTTLHGVTCTADGVQFGLSVEAGSINTGGLWTVNARGIGSTAVGAWGGGGARPTKYGTTIQPTVAAFTGTTNGTTTVSSVSSFTGLFVGGLISSANADIPSGTTITALNPGGSSLTLSTAATGSHTGQSMHSVLPEMVIEFAWAPGHANNSALNGAGDWPSAIMYNDGNFDVFNGGGPFEAWAEEIDFCEYEECLFHMHAASEYGGSGQLNPTPYTDTINIYTFHIRVASSTDAFIRAYVNGTLSNFVNPQASQVFAQFGTPQYFIMNYGTNSGSLGNAGDCIADYMRWWIPGTPAGPNAITGSATNVANTSATLNGTINPQGASTNAYFEWGTTTAYGNTTPNQSEGSGSSNVNVNASITGLTPNTVYHYRQSASNTNGTTHGADATFTTTNLVTPTVQTGAATPVAATTAQLNGTVNPNGLDTTYFFNWGQTNPTTWAPSIKTTAGVTTLNANGSRLVLNGVTVWGLPDHITNFPGGAGTGGLTGTGFGATQYQNLTTVVNGVAATGANVARFRTLADDAFQGVNGPCGCTIDQYVAAIAKWVKAFAAKGIYTCICDWDPLDGSFNGSLWVGKANRANGPFALFEAICQALPANYPWLLFEPFNEPNPGSGSFTNANLISNFEPTLLWLRDTCGYTGPICIDPINWANSGTAGAGYDNTTYNTLETYDAGLFASGQHQIMWAKHSYYAPENKAWLDSDWQGAVGGSQTSHLIWATEVGNANPGTNTAWSSAAASDLSAKSGTMQNYGGVVYFVWGNPNSWADANTITSGNTWSNTVTANLPGTATSGIGQALAEFQTPTVDAGPGTLTVNAASTVINLTPLTSYEFQIVATNSADVSEGQYAQFTTTAIIVPPPPPPPPSGVVVVSQLIPNQLTYYFTNATNFQTIAILPVKNTQWTSVLNGAGSWSAQLAVEDTRITNTNWQAATVPNKTCFFVDYNGTLLFGGLVGGRKYNAKNQMVVLSGPDAFGYLAQRFQANDYSGTWAVSPGASVSTIAYTILNDALAVPHSLPLQINQAAQPTSSALYITLTAPISQRQTVASLLTVLSELSYTVGVDSATDVQWSSSGVPTPAISLSYPRRGKVAGVSPFAVDLSTVIDFEFDEDGSRQSTGIVEMTGSSGGVFIEDINADPLAAGWVVTEQVVSRAAFSPVDQTEQVLAAWVAGDLATYSYPLTVPQVTLPLFSPSLMPGTYSVGDDILLYTDQGIAGSGIPGNPRFPSGLSVYFRIVQIDVDVNDEGVSTVKLTLNIPPGLTPIPPAWT